MSTSSSLSYQFSRLLICLKRKKISSKLLNSLTNLQLNLFSCIFATDIFEKIILIIGGACGYDDVVREGYGLDSTAAVSNVLFKNGQACGACYEIKCINSPQWCKRGQQSLFVTATNQCPPNYYQSSDNGGWCNEPREHFDLAEPAFLKIAEYSGGIVPVQYRRFNSFLMLYHTRKNFVK